MDGLCLKTGIHGVTPSISLNGSLELRSNLSHVNAVGKSSYVDKPPPKTSLSFSSFSFKHPFKSLWNGDAVNSRYNGMALDDAVLIENKEDMEVISPEEEAEVKDSDRKNGSWVLKIMDVRSLWSDVEKKNGDGEEEEAEEVNAAEKNGGNECELQQNSDDEEEGCENCRALYEEEEENDVEFDSSSFSRFLRRVTLADARLYARISYLGNLAYSIPKIELGNPLKNMGLRFITSSLEKREMDIRAEKDMVPVESQGEESQSNGDERPEDGKNNGIQKSASTAYDIATSAASYLHSYTASILPFELSKVNTNEDSEMASLMATTESVTAVVAAKEEVKQAVADNLKSTCSSPCEWFICDDDRSGTRFFVIQGSESLASWQANLLFEPIQFEGLDVVVHRGIYEAAKGIYDQMLPEVHAHLKSRGSRATLRFTGHSLGGSLALLINLMLLIRLEAPISLLLPVITFGSPSIMCGGNLLLRKLGLPWSHVQAVTMHRDIVPRVFSCKYPSHVAKLLKALNGNFRNHPCLNNQKLLYAPMGELLILQPDKKFSPNHHLLPSGSGLYLLDCPAEKLLYAAKMAFLNSPHPLEILSDRAAYGHGGTVQRDHDMESYLKSIREVIRQELKQISKAKKEHRRRVWQRVIGQSNPKSTIEVGSEAKFNFSGAVQRGRVRRERTEVRKKKELQANNTSKYGCTPKRSASRIPSALLRSM